MAQWANLETIGHFNLAVAIIITEISGNLLSFRDANRWRWWTNGGSVVSAK